MTGAAQRDLGFLAFKQRKFDEAEKAYLAAIQLSPNDMEAYYGLGEVHRERRQFDKAERMYRKALQLAPDSSNVYTALGVTFHERGLVDEAETQYRQAIQLTPKNHLAYCNLGNLYRQFRHDLDQAEKFYRQALQLSTAKSSLDTPDWLFRHDFEQVGTSDRITRALSPELAEPYNGLALIAAARGNLAEAENLARKATDLAPNSPVMNNTLAEVLRRRGRLNDAEQFYRKALQLDPDYRYATGQAAAGWFGTAADAVGNVFFGGEAIDTAQTDHGLVLMTDTSAASWVVSDDLISSPPFTQTKIFGLGRDANGNLYQSGGLGAPCTKSSCPGDWWFVRKSADRGQTWTTVDNFQYAANAGTEFPRGVAGDPSGKVFVCGSWMDAQSTSHLLVRESNGGEPGTWSMADELTGAYARGINYVSGIGVFAVGFTEQTKKLGYGWLVRRSLTGEPGTWSTVDLVQLPYQGAYEQYGAAASVAGDAQGNVYVAGSFKKVVGSGKTAMLAKQWLVRRSRNGGGQNSWVDADAFVYTAGQDSSAWGISRDASGNCVAVGRGFDAQGTDHWIVRRSDAQGGWQTADEYQLAPGQDAEAQGIVSDSAGNALVNGWAYDANGIEHWIVRRLVP
jgi:Flp pilus assembly protein TadD